MSDHTERCNWLVSVWDPWDMAAPLDEYVIEDRTEREAEKEALAELRATPQYNGCDFSLKKAPE